MIERVVAYNPDFDRNAYETLEAKDKKRLDAYTKKQLETHLGERFNVLLSQTRYEIRDNQIFGENTNEPFMQMLERGVKYRRKNGNPVDFEREEAELVGFGKIEEKLTNGETKIGTMMLSVSPPGEKDSIYKHNFYDVFTLKEDEKGRFVEAIRYSSSLTIEEYRERLKLFSNLESISGDADFLRQPHLVDQKLFKTSDEIHSYLHRNHEFITKEEFDQIISIVSPLIISYVNTMSEKPFDQNLQLLTYNAILNKADVVLGMIKKRNNKKLLEDYVIQSKFTTNIDIFMFGGQPVRITPTGCGTSGGFSVSQSLNITASPFGVLEFGLKNKQEEWFSCPKCKYKANGPVGDTCPGCRLTKQDYIKEGEKTC